MTRAVYEGVHFSRLRDWNSGRTIDNLDLRNCTFENCSLSAGGDPQKRTTVRNVRLFQCSVPMRFGTIGAPVLDEVIVEDFRSGAILILNGAAFRHVVLRGHMPPVNFNEKMAAGAVPEEMLRLFREDNAAFYERVDWALDISQARFYSARLSSVPGQLVRRDPETQILVSRARLLEASWDSLPLPATTRISIESCLKSRFEYQVIVAGKRDKRFGEQMRGIELLRRQGIASAD